MEVTIPITIAITYNTYALHYSQGLLDEYLGGTICPKYPHECSPQGPPSALELTNSTVDRTAFMLEKDGEGVDNIVKRTLIIVLVICSICKSRYRLLPADILPRKLYSLPVIELSVSLYNRGDLSLHQVVWDELYGDHNPQHTTLHAWTEGLGAWWQGRTIGDVAFSIPAARIQAELEIRYPRIKSLPLQSIWINPKRYRSQGRMERLKACKQFEIIGTNFDIKSSLKWCELNRLIISWGNWFGLGFKTGIGCTAIERTDCKDVITWRQIFPKEPLSCPIHGRSPPFDSN